MVSPVQQVVLGPGADGRLVQVGLGARRRGDLEAGRRALLLAGVVNRIEAGAGSIRQVSDRTERPTVRQAVYVIHVTA